MCKSRVDDKRFENAAGGCLWNPSFGASSRNNRKQGENNVPVDGSSCESFLSALGAEKAGTPREEEDPTRKNSVFSSADTECGMFEARNASYDD